MNMNIISGLPETSGVPFYQPRSMFFRSEVNESSHMIKPITLDIASNMIRTV